MRIIDGDKIREVLIERGQNDIGKFRLGDTIRYTPSEVQEIVNQDIPSMTSNKAVIAWLRDKRAKLWDDAKKYLNDVLDENHPILIKGSIAEKMYQNSVDKVRAIGEAIKILEEDFEEE